MESCEEFESEVVCICRFPEVKKKTIICEISLVYNIFEKLTAYLQESKNLPRAQVHPKSYLLCDKVFKLDVGRLVTICEVIKDTWWNLIVEGLPDTVPKHNKAK